MKVALFRFPVLDPADAQDVRLSAAHRVLDFDTTGLPGVDDRRCGVAEDEHAGLVADCLEGDVLRVFVARVRQVDPVTGRVSRLALVVVASDLAFLLWLHEELDSAAWAVQHRDAEVELRDVELDGLPDFVSELGHVAELAKEAAILHLLLERAKPFKLLCVNVVGQRCGREVQVNGLALIDGAFDLFHRARHRVGSGRAEPAAEQREDYIRVIHALSVDERLWMVTQLRHRGRLPAPGLKDDLLVPGVRVVPSVNRSLDSIPSISGVRRGRDHDAENVRAVGHVDHATGRRRQGSLHLPPRHDHRPDLPAELAAYPTPYGSLMELTIVVADGVDADGAALAADYWDTTEVSDASVTYTHKVSDVGARHGVASGVVSRRVAALAAASHPAARCSQCQSQLSFTTRATLGEFLAPPRWQYRRNTSANALCSVCQRLAVAEREAQERRIAERDRRREEAAQLWLEQDRLDDTVAERVTALRPGSLVEAVGLSRSPSDHDEIRAAGRIDGSVLLELDSLRVATIVNPAEVVVWESDDVDTEPTFERWSPGKARLRLTPGIAEVLDRQLAADRVRFAADPDIRAMAHAALLREMVKLVDFHILGCNLPELTETQADRLREIFVSHPSVPLGKVISAAWMSTKDGAAALQTNRGMPPWKATTHVVNKMATRLNAPAKLPSYNIPGRYVPGGMLLVLIPEVLGLRLIETSLDEVAGEATEVAVATVVDEPHDGVTSTPSAFDEARARVRRLLEGALEELHSDWPKRAELTTEQERAAREAHDLITAAKAALDQATSPDDISGPFRT